MMTFKIQFAEKNQADVDSIPKTFLQPNFDLSRRETFYEVFPFVGGTEENEGAPAGGCRQVLQSGKLLQEKLSHHLDVIEMQIANQIAHKSDAFFQAVASHDTVREEIGRALTAVQALRLKVKNIDATVAQDSLKG
jgi:vacuolar protein sorting-associated protein 54